MVIDTIYNEDCTVNMDSRIDDGSVDLVVTDCPYRISTGGGMNFRGEGCMFSSKHKSTKDGKFFDNNDLDFSEWLPIVYRKLKERAHCYIMVNSRNLKELWQKAEDAGFQYHNLLVWDKGSCTPNRWYMQAFECILFLRKGDAFPIENKGDSTIIHVPGVNGPRFHPTEKPVRLMRRLIENSSKPGALVLDPFMGGGSTAVACIQSKRHFVGFELDPEFYSVAVKRVDEEIADSRRALFDD